MDFLNVTQPASGSADTPESHELNLVQHLWHVRKAEDEKVSNFSCMAFQTSAEGEEDIFCGWGLKKSCQSLLAYRRPWWWA